MHTSFHRISFVLILLIAIFPQANQGTILFHDLTFKSKLSHREPFNEIDLLPREVRIALTGLKEKGIAEYSIVGEFKTRAELYQRLTEAAWPIRNIDHSIIIIGYKRDAIKDRYKIIWEKNGVVIARRNK